MRTTRSLIVIAMVDPVQMTLDEGLVVAVDRAVKKLGTTRSAFARFPALRRRDPLEG